MDFEHSVHNGDFSSLNSEHNNFSHSNWIFYSIRKKQKVSSVKCGLHTATESLNRIIKMFRNKLYNRYSQMLMVN